MTTVASQLLSRRVPQLLALYAGVGWGIIEFASFVEDRYMVSPHWVDISFISLFLLLPSVLLLTWNHGQTGKDELTRTERLFIPSNLILAVVVLVIVFRGRDLGAMTTTVVIQGEDGSEIERVIPKSTFRKRVGLFLFDPAGDVEDWALRSFEVAVATDLGQDMFVDVRHTPFYEERLEQAGFKGGHGVPFSLQREIAQEQNREFFVTGRLGENAGVWTASYAVHDAARGRTLEEGTLTGSDPMVLADELSLALRHDLEVPAAHIEQSTDLPVSEIFTGVGQAFEAYGRAMEALLVDSDYAQADSLLAVAVEVDPGFAMAYLARYGVAVFGGQSELATASLEGAVDNIYRLPERDRFQVNAELHLIRQQPERARMAFQMKVELFPDDIRGHQGLATLYMLDRETALAISSLERVLEIDPAQTEFLAAIGELYQQDGQFERARDYFERYSSAFPGDPRPPAALAGLLVLMGEHDAAVDQMNRALALEPGNVRNLLTLAHVMSSIGAFEEAEGFLAEALASAGSPPERVTVLGGHRTYAEFRGRSAEALEHALAAVELSETFQPAFQVSIGLMMTVDLFVSVGDTAGAFAALERARPGLAGPFAGFMSIGETILYRELEQPERIDEAATLVEGVITAYGFELFRPLALAARAEAHYLRGEYPEALSLLESAQTLEPTSTGVRARLGRMLREMGELDRAATELEQALVVEPYYGRANLELGLVYLAQGRTDEAREQLERARVTWADADPGHRWATLLQATLDR